MSSDKSNWTSISLKHSLREELRRMRDEQDAESYDSLLRAELGVYHQPEVSIILSNKLGYD